DREGPHRDLPGLLSIRPQGAARGRDPPDRPAAVPRASLSGTAVRRVVRLAGRPVHGEGPGLLAPVLRDLRGDALDRHGPGLLSGAGADPVRAGGHDRLPRVPTRAGPRGYLAPRYRSPISLLLELPARAWLVHPDVR